MTLVNGAPDTRILVDAQRPLDLNREKLTPGRRAVRIAGYLVLIVAAAAVLLPFFWMVSSSLKGPNDVFTIPVKWIPPVWKWDNYVQVWSQTGMGTWWKNTLLLSVVVTLLQVLTGSFAAYASKTFAKALATGLPRLWGQVSLESRSSLLFILRRFLRSFGETTIRAARTIGSRVVLGAAPWPPTPRTSMSTLSTFAMAGPGV